LPEIVVRPEGRSQMKSHIAILASGNGSNAEEIIQYFKQHPSADVRLILSNNPKAYVLTRAANHNIDARVFSREEFADKTKIISWLKEKEITHVVLAGFLWLIPDYLIRAYPNKIINIHPALLPKYGGKGMYGLKVHEAVKAAGEKETGITIHLVNEHYDEGEILFQGKCKIEETYTAEQIAKCVHQLEYEHYPRVIENWVNNSR
jgi:phosphoribosylglycinamide formyltransferase-1